MAKRAFDCPGCNKRIIMDDDALQVLHEPPLCTTFQTVCNAAGLKPVKEQWTVIINKDTGSVVRSARGKVS